MGRRKIKGTKSKKLRKLKNVRRVYGSSVRNNVWQKRCYKREKAGLKSRKREETNDGIFIV